MIKSARRAYWSKPEKVAATASYNVSTTAEEFLLLFRQAVPDAPPRSLKAYLMYLYETVGDDRRPVYKDIRRACQIAKREAAVTAKLENAKREGDVGANLAWMNDIKDGPAEVPAKKMVSHFTTMVPIGTVTPQPHANTPKHYRVPVYTQMSFLCKDIVNFFSVSEARAKEMLDSGVIPSHDGAIRRDVFMTMHEAMSDGLEFDAACERVRETFAEKPVGEAPVESAKVDPDKVREGSIPNPLLRSPIQNPGAKLSLRDSLDDPNPDAKEIFTVEEAANVLGMDKPDRLLAAISEGVFPSLMEAGKCYILRADLKRLKGNLSVGLSIEEALKRGGAPECVLSVPVETSWSDNLAPLTPVEADEVAHLTPVKPAAPATETVDPAVTSDQHRWFTLEGLKSGVFSMDEAVRLLGGASDPVKTAWAFGLLREGRITVDQTVKLLG